MTCRKIKQLLTPWLDGELKPKQADELRVWLDGCEQVRQCSDCRKLIDESRSFHRLYNVLPRQEFPAFLHHQIMDKINSREAARHHHAVRIRWQTVPAALAILMSLYVGSLVGISTFNAQTGKNNPKSEVYTFGETNVASNFYLSGE
jgi:anti-sigma factor RsiW